LGLRTPAGASRGGSFFDRVRDVSAGDGMHTYSCVRYATLPSVCTDYARSVSQADETGFYAPSVAHNALPRRPLRLRPLRCGKMCGVTCAHRWPVLTSCYVVERCEMMCCTTYTYIFYGKVRFPAWWGIHSLVRANSEAV
jgi:hypothetical protein